MLAYGTNSTTGLVASISQPTTSGTAMHFAYTYDVNGNIASETRNWQTTTYVYDALGQLIRVNDPHENATWVYSARRSPLKIRGTRERRNALGELIIRSVE